LVYTNVSDVFILILVQSNIPVQFFIKLDYTCNKKRRSLPGNELPIPLARHHGIAHTFSDELIQDNATVDCPR